MEHVWLVAFRELRTHLRRPTFYFTTFGIPALMAGLLLGVGLITKMAGLDDVQRDITTAPKKPAGLVDQSGLIATMPPDYAPVFTRFSDEQAAAQALSSGTISAYFVVAPDYRSTGHVSRVSQQASFLQSTGFDVRALTAILRANLSSDQQLIARLDQPASFETIVVASGSPTTPNDIDQARGKAPEIASGVSSGFAFLLAFSMISGGNLLLSAIAEEKTSRTMEVLLTSIKPWQLLAGKLGGLGTVGLLQLAIWLGMGRLVQSGAQQLPISSTTARVAATTIPPSIWFWTLIFFVLGYLLYGSLMATLAAIGTSARESGQISSFLTLPVLLPVWFLVAITDRPDGAVALALSFFPLTAPTTMILRLGLAEVPIWELLVSVAIQMLTIAGALALAARLFRATTLLTGAKPTPRALWQAWRNA